MDTPSGLPPARAMIGRWSVDRYIQFVRWWVVGSGLVLLLMVLRQVDQAWVALVELAVCGLTGLRVKRHGGGRLEALMAGAFLGFGLGLIVSLGRFALRPGFVWLMNIIVETALTAVIAGLFSAGLASLAQLIRSTPTQH